jgi:hypothetical protein
VDEVIRCGAIDAGSFSALVRQLFVRAVVVWIARNTRRDRLEAELGYGLAIALLGVVTDQAREQVQARLFQYQAKLLGRRRSLLRCCSF